jgi:hypothetical protein
MPFHVEEVARQNEIVDILARSEIGRVCVCVCVCVCASIEKSLKLLASFAASNSFFNIFIKIKLIKIALHMFVH